MTDKAYIRLEGSYFRGEVSAHIRRRMISATLCSSGKSVYCVGICSKLHITEFTMLVSLVYQCSVKYIHFVVQHHHHLSPKDLHQLKLYPLNRKSPFCPLFTVFGNYYSVFCLWKLDYSRYVIEMGSYTICPFVAGLLYLMDYMASIMINYWINRSAHLIQYISIPKSGIKVINCCLLDYMHYK